MATIVEQIKEQLATHGITVSELNVPEENAQAILEALESVPAPTTPAE
jgi:NADH/NAD ratio-sensing transcriptional regulator Rex